MSRNDDTKKGRIAPASSYWQRMHEVQKETGYHPWAILESIEDREKFEKYFALLPEDLTHVDIAPLYLLAVDNDQKTQLRKRENAWKPDPDNLSEKYNGPLGEDREPTRTNLEKWREAVKAKERAHLTRFDRDMDLMEKGDVPHSLKGAAQSLVALARSADFEDAPGSVSPWDGCMGTADVLAIAAAVRVALSALAEIDAEARRYAHDIVGEVRSDLALLERLEGNED